MLYVYFVWGLAWVMRLFCFDFSRKCYSATRSESIQLKESSARYRSIALYWATNANDVNISSYNNNNNSCSNTDKSSALPGAAPWTTSTWCRIRQRAHTPYQPHRLSLGQQVLHGRGATSVWKQRHDLPKSLFIELEVMPGPSWKPTRNNPCIMELLPIWNVW